MERISQSRDDDDGADDAEDDEFDDYEDGEDDYYEDEDGEDYDENGNPYALSDGNRSGEGSEDELMRRNKRLSVPPGVGNMSNRNRGAGGGTMNDWGTTQQEFDANASGGQNQSLQNQNNQQPEKKRKIHDYSRIVTNPRYKFFDDETCGSAYFNDCNCSERELDIRDMIKKNEQTKKRRERRRLRKKEEQENKKQNSEGEGKDDESEKNKTDGDDDNENTEEDGLKRRSRRRKEDESESKSKSRARSESSRDSDENRKQPEEVEDEEDNQNTIDDRDTE